MFTPLFFSFRRVTIRRRVSARAQRSTGSSAGVRGSMSHTGWVRPSIPPPTPLDRLYQSVSQAALRSEVQDTHTEQDLNVYSWVHSSVYQCYKVICAVISYLLCTFLPQVRLRFRPCSISPTSRLATLFTVTSPLSLVSSPVVISQSNCKITSCKLCSWCKFHISRRIHPWSRNTPPEAAGTCQPTVRLYWRSKSIWNKWWKTHKYVLIWEYYTEHDNSKSHSRHMWWQICCAVSRCSPRVLWGPCTPQPCILLLPACCLHHQWRCRSPLQRWTLPPWTPKHTRSSSSFLQVFVFMRFTFSCLSSVPVARPHSRALPRALLATASSLTPRAGRGSTTTASNSQPPSPSSPLNQMGDGTTTPKQKKSFRWVIP